MSKIIKVGYDENKLFALKHYAEQRGISIEEELAQAAEALYQKLVPGSVKAFIQTQSEAMNPKKGNLKSSSSAVEQSPGGEQI